jgi:hypothetical protein
LTDRGGRADPIRGEPATVRTREGTESDS